MTITGFLIGILAGIGVLAIVLIAFMVLFARRMEQASKRGENPVAKFFEGNGFAEFRTRAQEKLPTAAYNSFVAAELPLPSVEVRIEVAGRAKSTPCYRLVIRMGYRREDHLQLVQSAVTPHGLAFERFDKGKGMIKLRSEKVDDLDPLLEIASAIKTAVMYDLSDSRITVTQTLRPA